MYHSNVRCHVLADGASRCAAGRWDRLDLSDGKPIRLVSGTAPGSATDIVGRAVGEAFRSEPGAGDVEPHRCHGRHEDTLLRPRRRPSGPDWIAHQHTIRRDVVTIRCATSQAWRRSHPFPIQSLRHPRAPKNERSRATAKRTWAAQVLVIATRRFGCDVKFNQARLGVLFKRAVEAIQALTGRSTTLCASLRCISPGGNSIWRLPPSWPHFANVPYLS